ncbi:hypothetical protein BC941DRAFT_474660 [Chlamydoabsidia padenii]|nr:hypothetical protein BC941DRAFT_474660 [Chlamydoabsidia padenii]
MATYYFGDVLFFLEHRGGRNTQKRTVVLKINGGTPEKQYVFWKTMVIGMYTMAR